MTNKDDSVWERVKKLDKELGEECEREKNKLKAHYNSGVAYQDKGNLEQAIVEFQEVLRIDPKFVLAHTTLGNLYLNQGEFEQAFAEYRDALRIDPNNAEAHKSLRYAKGKILFDRGTEMFEDGKCEEAIKNLEEAVEILPEEFSFNAYLNLGKALVAANGVRS